MTGGDGAGLTVIAALRTGDFDLRVDLEIPAGSTAVLLGPNGAGKTTLLDTLAGLRPLDAGSIVLGGRVLDDPRRDLFVAPEGRRMGVVFQNYLLFDHLDVIDNVAFGLVAAGMRRRDARRQVAPWLERFDLVSLADRRPRQLSGGQAQRVALARALAAEPLALLLDEPMAAVDVATRMRLRRVLGDHLATFEGPRLVITHDPADAFLLADIVFVLEDGRITQRGTPDEIRGRPTTPYVAAVAGVNFLAGVNRSGRLVLDDHDVELVTSDTHTSGPVIVSIPPSAISVHTSPPEGSPRNSWATALRSIEPLGEIVRLGLADPLPLSVDVTPAAVAALDLAPGVPVWVSVKATEILLQPVGQAQSTAATRAAPSGSRARASNDTPRP